MQLRECEQEGQRPDNSSRMEGEEEEEEEGYACQT
jgi:hypothetical protein